MVKQVAQRYLVAAVVFAIAVVWTGIGLTAAFESLLAFTLAYVATAAVQRRRAVAHDRSRRSRSRSRSSASRPRREHAGVYDDEAGGEADWPQLAERW